MHYLVVVITHDYRKAPHNDAVTTWTVLKSFSAISHTESIRDIVPEIIISPGLKRTRAPLRPEMPDQIMRLASMEIITLSKVGVYLSQVKLRV